MTHVVGAKSGEVAIMNSLTANLNLLLITFYRPTKDRFKILVEGKVLFLSLIINLIIFINLLLLFI